MENKVIEKLNVYGFGKKISEDGVKWLDVNDNETINDNLYKVMKKELSENDYDIISEAFEHLFDFYNADTIENLIDTWDMEKQIMIEDEDWDELKELTTDIEYSLRDNGEGSYFRSGDYFTDDALSIWNFVRWLANEED